MSEALYVAGGVYSSQLESGGKQFGLVHSSNGIPYVVRQSSVETFWNVSKHHSHLYRVVITPIGVDVVLQTVSCACLDSVEAPGRMQLSGELASKVLTVIEGRKFTAL